MADERDDQEEPMGENSTSEESSFKGRLQLKNFMFTGTSNSSSSSEPRRSQRLTMTQSTLSFQHSSPSKSKKRKTPTESPEPENKKPNRRKATTLTSTPTPISSSPSPKKKRTRKSSSYAPPSTYAHLPLLPDAIAPNLLILTIGLNPGLQTARTGHAYAHPSNLYWKLLFSSGITPERCSAQEDQTMPARFSLGHTNIVARPSRNGAELSKAEMDEGVAMLEDKCRRWRPEVACVVGKSIWESVFRVRHGRALRKGEFSYGWQEERMGVIETGDGEEGGWEGSRVFVATSTSGLAATLRPEEKERIWKVLGDWCVRRRKEREEEAVDDSVKVEVLE
ncbi:DNA glycosylase [Annulohypoxylon maeteangense]|uniref:DNA glycosylase n=1 Tax=Annulohypoxylon maeteangense TaxID=1927788 RepID=UPI0020080F98|nr:DNA glycosylase [Annulohypoxylon maeteangense]KAI0882193.1 DNA glycosylase [Annulohypoxylon maeteangense]